MQFATYHFCRTQKIVTLLYVSLGSHRSQSRRKLSLSLSLFCIQATGDPYYLDVGKTVIDNLNEHARVYCGFAGIKDVKLNTHEDR